MTRRIVFLTLVMAIPLLAWAATFSWLPDAQAPKPSTEEMTHGLRIDLKPKTQTVKAGEEATFKVMFYNLGPDPIQVIRPLDGSEARWQQPFHDFLARRDGGETMRWMMVGSRPARMKALSVEDVIKIEDEATADPWQGPYCDYLKKIRFDQPGTYEVWYLYYFERVNESRDIAGTPADVPRALRGIFTSNAVKVVVQAP